jgi:polyhydroxybutyrate depolymerase
MSSNPKSLALVTALVLAVFFTATSMLLSALALTPGTESKSLEFGGLTRTYLVHLPPRYDGKTPLPLVMVLHGAVQGADSVEHMSGMSAKALEITLLSSIGG